MLIQANNITKNYGTLPLFQGLSLTLAPGDKIGLVGANGCGKTTLLQILTDEEGLTEGIVSRQKGLTIGYIPQKLPRSPETLRNYLLESFQNIKDLRADLQRVEKQMAAPDVNYERLLLRYGQLQETYEEAGGYNLEDRVIGTLKGLGLGDKTETPLQELSGGQRVRVELARVLIEEADVLLLDEPTNHLDSTGIQWLESWLFHTKQTFLVISHDRQFLDNVVTGIAEIEEGKLIRYPGNYTKFASLKKERLKALQKSFQLQQKEIRRLEAMIRRYRQWANEADNEDFYRKAKELERRVEKLRATLSRPPQEPKKRLQEISQASRSGKEVLVATDIGKLVGEQLLFSDSSFVFYRQEKIALMGDNGSGKSTLIRCLLGELPLDEGQIRIGNSVKIGYLPQQLHFDDPQLRLVDHVKRQITDEQKARQVLARFGFYADDVTKRIKDLSGGEQMRLYLLGLLQQKINFLILDEPTNHLDIYGKEELEEILEEYKESLLVVSHDRYFLNKIATSGKLLIQDGRITKK